MNVSAHAKTISWQLKVFNKSNTTLTTDSAGPTKAFKSAYILMPCFQRVEIAFIVWDHVLRQMEWMEKSKTCFLNKVFRMFLTCVRRACGFR